MPHDLALSAIELCAGVGMLGEGVRAAFGFLGIGHRTLCYVEREAPAAAQLAALMEAGALDPAPIWSDLVTFRGRDWRGKVDCIIAGFPCQDISIAGRRAGLDGKRSGLFFNILDIADDCGAWCLALENVSAIATATASVVDEAEGELFERAAARVLGELADRGWDAEWITLSASDVGASHGRARWFCFAWRVADAGCGDARRLESQRVGGRSDPAEHHARGEAVAHAARYGHDGPLREAGSGRRVRAAGDSMADAERAERWPQRPAGAGRVEGPDAGRREAHGGTGIADAALALAPGHGRHEGRPEPGREQGRSDASECGGPVAQPERARRKTAGSGPEIDAGREPEPRCGDMADTGRARLQGSEQRPARNGNRGGRKHMDQLANFVTHSPSSPQAQPTSDGQQSSPSAPTSPRRLNPAFGCWLMGWPVWWTNPAITSSVRSEMESYRSALRSHLSSLLGEQDSREWKEAA